MALLGHHFRGGESGFLTKVEVVSFRLLTALLADVKKILHLRATFHLRVDGPNIPTEPKDAGKGPNPRFDELRLTLEVHGRSDDDACPRQRVDPSLPGFWSQAPAQFLFDEPLRFSKHLHVPQDGRIVLRHADENRSG